MIVKVAKAIQADSIVCITETGLLARHLNRLSDHFRVIATTTNSETYDTLTKAGVEVIRLPLHTADKYTQIRHAISVVLQSSSISIGDFVVCAIGRDVYKEAGVFLMSPPAETKLVSGLGTRHAAAAAVTMRTAATAIIVSATDGQVRAFSGGKLVLQVDPEIAHRHIGMNA
jgi:hypothetical protein